MHTKIENGPASAVRTFLSVLKVMASCHLTFYSLKLKDGNLSVLQLVITLHVFFDGETSSGSSSLHLSLVACFYLHTKGFWPSSNGGSASWGGHAVPWSMK